jgi:hypothetical protein
MLATPSERRPLRNSRDPVRTRAVPGFFPPLPRKKLVVALWEKEARKILLVRSEIHVVLKRVCL